MLSYQKTAFLSNSRKPFCKMKWAKSSFSLKEVRTKKYYQYFSSGIIGGGDFGGKTKLLAGRCHQGGADQVERDDGRAGEIRSPAVRIRQERKGVRQGQDEGRRDGEAANRTGTREGTLNCCDLKHRLFVV